MVSLKEQNVEVIGVSMDTVPEQRAFSDKFSVPFPLLCDTSGDICDAFRVKHPGSKPRRETFIFRRGVLVHHDRSVDPANQAKDALSAISEISSRGRGS